MSYDIHSKDYKNVNIDYYLKHGSLRKTSALYYTFININVSEFG